MIGHQSSTATFSHEEEQVTESCEGSKKNHYGVSVHTDREMLWNTVN